MTTIARRIKSTPARTASETWNVITNLISLQNSQARTELQNISGIACSLIADEAFNSPMIIYGNGPRIRVYCLYGEDAIIGDDSNESPINSNPTENDWHISLPCPAEDLDWVQDALKKHSNHITARDKATPLDEENAEAGNKDQQMVTINKEVFLGS